MGFQLVWGLLELSGKGTVVQVCLLVDPWANPMVISLVPECVIGIDVLRSWQKPRVWLHKCE